MKTLTAAHKPFAGLANYIEIFHDPVFIKSLGNTLLFTVCCLLFQFLIGFVLADILQSEFPAFQDPCGDF